MDEDRVINKLIEHDERLTRIEENMVTKAEFVGFRDQVLAANDQMITILQRLDQERIFTIEWVKRVESDVEKNTQEISRMKQVLKIA